MDLPLSTDFDPELLHWDEDDEDTGNNDVGTGVPGAVDNFASEEGGGIRQESALPQQIVANAPLPNFASTANVNVGGIGDTTTNVNAKTNANAGRLLPFGLLPRPP